MTAELDASKLPEHWAEALAKRGCDQDDLGTLVADIYDKSPVTVFPERSDLFRAFHLTRLEDVRAVILGPDPYPRPKQAHGLAFSVPNGVATPGRSRPSTRTSRTILRSRSAGHKTET